MKNLNYPIFYLTSSDIDYKGVLINKNIPKDIPVLVMIQNTGCKYCTLAKPEYQKLADNYGYYLRNNKPFEKLYQKHKKNIKKELVFVTTVNPKDVDSKIFKEIDKSFRGYPHFILYYKDKRYTYDGDRTSAALQKFIENKV